MGGAYFCGDGFPKASGESRILERTEERPSRAATATDFIPAKLGEPVDHIEDRDGLRIQVSYCHITSVGVDALRSRRMLGGFKGQLRQLAIETVIVENRNHKSGSLDPRLISDAYRLLFIEKSAPSDLMRVSGDKDYEPMLWTTRPKEIRCEGKSDALDEEEPEPG